MYSRSQDFMVTWSQRRYGNTRKKELTGCLLKLLKKTYPPHHPVLRLGAEALPFVPKNTVCVCVFVCGNSTTGLGWVTQLVRAWSSTQRLRLDPWSGHMQASTNECIDKWKTKSMFLSLHSSLNQ